MDAGNPFTDENIKSLVGSDFSISDDAVSTIQRLLTPIFESLWNAANIKEAYAINDRVFPNEYGVILHNIMEETYKNSPYSLSDNKIVLKMLYSQGFYVIKDCINGAIQSAKLWYSTEINSFDIYVSVCNNQYLKKVSKEQLDCSIFNHDTLLYIKGDFIENMINTVINPIGIERGVIIIIYNMEEKYKRWINDKINISKNANTLSATQANIYLNTVENFTVNFLNTYNNNNNDRYVSIYNILVAYSNMVDPNVKEFVAKILYGFSE